jgi:uncharacterized membrane protein
MANTSLPASREADLAHDRREATRHAGRVSAERPDVPEASSSVRLSESSRVEAFSDGVFAIVITILVLDLRLPPHAPGHLLDALTGLWASLFAFSLSFLRVAVVWLNHHGLFSHVRRVNRTLLWINLGILATCMLMPFPTVVLADALRGGSLADLRVAMVLYALVGGLQMAAWLPVWPYLRDHPELAQPRTEAAYFDSQRIRPWIGMLVNAIAVLVATIAPVPALVLSTLALVFIAVTSDGIGAGTLLARRHSRASKEERTARST